MDLSLPRRLQLRVQFCTDLRAVRAKKYALPALKEVPSDSAFYITANRLIKFLKYFKDMDNKWVPCNSLLREFIGGSCFAEVDE